MEILIYASKCLSYNFLGAGEGGKGGGRELKATYKQLLSPTKLLQG